MITYIVVYKAKTGTHSLILIYSLRLNGETIENSSPLKRTYCKFHSRFEIIINFHFFRIWKLWILFIANLVIWLFLQLIRIAEIYVTMNTFSTISLKKKSIYYLKNKIFYYWPIIVNCDHNGYKQIVKLILMGKINFVVFLLKYNSLYFIHSNNTMC